MFLAQGEDSDDEEELDPDCQEPIEGEKQEEQCDDVCEIGGIGAFEDNPMPILKARIAGVERPLRVLIDSGAAISLISEALEGYTEDSVKVRVANGSRVSLSRTFNIPLELGSLDGPRVVLHAAKSTL